MQGRIMATLRLWRVGEGGGQPIKACVKASEAGAFGCLCQMREGGFL